MSICMSNKNNNALKQSKRSYWRTDAARQPQHAATGYC